MFRPRVPAGDANLECDFLFRTNAQKLTVYSRNIDPGQFWIDLRLFKIFKKKSWLSDPNLFPRWINGGGTHSRFPKNLKRYQKSREIVQKTQRNFIIVLFISILDKIWPIYKFWKISIFSKKDPNSSLWCWMPPSPAPRSLDWGRGVPKILDFPKIAENIFFLGKRVHRIDAICEGLLFAAIWRKSCVRIFFDFVQAPFFAENPRFPITFS